MKIALYQPLSIYELGKRSNQEDSIYPSYGTSTVNDHLYILCDGMGGHDKGEVASNLVCKVLGEILYPVTANGTLSDRLFADALESVYQQLDLKSDGDDERKMGTTMTCVCFHNGGCLMAHIGDSRIYHIRPSEHRMLYKSRDHSLVYDRFLAGEITKEDMNTARNRNVITKAIMPGEDFRVKADIAHTTDIKPGDYFYLCSDGMLENMDDEEIVKLFSSNMSDEDLCEELKYRTKDNKDNHSAHILHVKSVTREKDDDTLLNDEKDARCNSLIWENISVSVPEDNKNSFYKRFFILSAIVLLVALAVVFTVRKCTTSEVASFFKQYVIKGDKETTDPISSKESEKNVAKRAQDAADKVKEVSDTKQNGDKNDNDKKMLQIMHKK